MSSVRLGLEIEIRSTIWDVENVPLNVVTVIYSTPRFVSEVVASKFEENALHFETLQALETSFVIFCYIILLVNLFKIQNISNTIYVIRN